MCPRWKRQVLSSLVSLVILKCSILAHQVNLVITKIDRPILRTNVRSWFEKNRPKLESQLVAGTYREDGDKFLSLFFPSPLLLGGQKYS